MAVVKVQGTPFDPVIAKATAALNAYSPRAMQTSAQRLAQTQVQPQIAGQQAAYGTQQQLLQNLYNRQTGFSLALAKLSQPNADAAMQPYLAAANTLSGLGQGISGAVGQDWQNAASQASQTAQGLTNQGSVQGLYDPSGLQASGYTTGFALPGASLANQAVVAASDARNRQIASADQLGVLAANTQSQQALTAADNARQLAAIRSQVPGLVQQSLSNQQGLRQNAFDTLSSLTANRSGYLQTQAQMAQQAAQHAADLAESHRAAVATEANARANTAVASGYLGQAGQQIAGKVKAQGIANASNLQNLTGLQVDPNTGKTTGKLAPGWINVNGNRIPYTSYVNSIVSQARIDYYNSRSAGNTAKAQTDLVGAAQKLLTTGATPKAGTPATYSVQPIYDSAGKRTGGYTRIQTKAGSPGGTVVPYSQMVQSLVALNPNDPNWVKQATAMVNGAGAYGQGQNGRPYEGKLAAQKAKEVVTTGIAAGLPFEDILARVRQSGLIPDVYILPAINQARTGIGNLGRGTGRAGSSVLSILGG